MDNSDIINPFAQVTEAANQPSPVDPVNAPINPFSADYKAPKSAFGLGIEHGTQGLKSAAGGVAAAAGEAIGSDALRNYGLGVVKSSAPSSDEAPAPSLTRARSVGDLIDFAKYGAGYAVPNALAAAAAGIIGRVGGGTLAKGVADAAEAMYLKNAGTVAGLEASNIAQQVGTIYPEAVNQNVENPLARSVAGGIAAGTLGTIPETYIAARAGLLGKAFTGGTTKEIALNALKEAGITGVGSAATGATQTGIQRYAAGQSIDDAEARAAYIENAGLGAVGGTIGGAVAGAVGAHSADTIRTEVVPSEKSNTPEVTTQPIPEPISSETTPQGRTPFQPVEDAVQQRTLARAKQAGLDITPEQADIVAPLVKDTVTGFNTAEHRYDTLKRAQEHVVATGEQGHYVEGDIANLGGLNKELGHSHANDVYRKFTDLFAENMYKTGGDVQLFRHGGDEFSAIILNSSKADIAAALAKTKEQAAEYVTDKKLGDIIHAKHPEDDSQRGTGVNFGISDIDPKETPKNIFSQADRIVETAKQGLTDVYGEPINPTGIVTPEERPGRVEQAVNGADTAIQSNTERPTAGGTLEAFAGGPARRLGDVTEYQPKSKLQEGTVIGEQPRQSQLDTFAAQLARIKKNNGELLSHDEINAAASLESTPSTPSVATAPSNARATFKQVSPEESRRFITDTASKVTDQHVAQLQSNGMIKNDRSATTIKTGLNKVVENMFAQGDAASAKSYLEDGIMRVLKGKINKIDAETIAADYTKVLMSTQHNFVAPDLSKPLSKTGSVSLFSKAKVDPEQVLKMHDMASSSATDLSTGRDSTGTVGYALPYSEREVSTPGRPTKEQLKQYADTNHDLLSQPDHMLLTKFDDATGNTILSVARTTPDFTTASQLAHEAGLTGMVNLRDMSYVAADGSGSPESPAVRANRFDAIMTTKGDAALSYLNRIIGNPDNLEVRTYVATDKAQGAGATRLTPTKSIIELALNAQDTLSVAAHEGFHYLESRVLNDSERTIVERAFAPGTETFKRLQEQVAKYDYLNGTKLTDEVAAIPAEARAYGYEFWRRGELQAPTVIGRFFDKIKSVIGRIANAMLGLGFQSHDDIFAAIDHGYFAREGGNPFRSLHLDSEPHPTDAITLMSRASLEDLATKSKNGEIQSSQFHGIIADMIGDKSVPEGIRERLFRNGSNELKGGYNSLKRAYFGTVSSQANIAQHSAGFKNVHGVITAYLDRKKRIIADNVESRLSTWLKGATDDDKKAVTNALLDRTVNAYQKTSGEYQKLYNGLNERQRAMFDQATSMIGHGLDEEFRAEQQSYARILGADSPQFKEWMATRGYQVEQLKNNGYFPERRYGDHTVHSYIEGADGKKITVYYAQHEREADARAELPQIQQAFAKEPSVKTEYGYKYKPEYNGSLSMQQFLDLAHRNGIELSQPEKERLASALVSADSTRRNRIFKRQNIVGYSDAGLRILSEFGVSLANKTSYSELGGSLNDAMQGKVVTPKFNPDGSLELNTQKDSNAWANDGELSGFYRNQADKLADFVMSPKEGSPLSSGLRAAASVQFLGGSFAAGVINLMSLGMNTAPWLIQHTSYTDAHAKVLSGLMTSVTNHKALSDLPTLQNKSIGIKGVDEVPGLRDALITAAQDGTIFDTEIHQIMGLARGQQYSFSGKVQDAIKAWMTPFQWTERINRLSTFIAAYKIAQDKNMDATSAYKLAKDTVDGTQFRYDEANRPAIARNPVGALLFTFKSYPIYATEMIVHLAKEKPAAAVAALAALSVASGVEGLPFAQDLENIIDGIAFRIFGSSFNTKRAMINVMKNASEAITGTDLSSIGMHGLASELSGMNVANRIGLGSMIPGSRIGAVDADYKSIVQDVLGPVGSMVGNYLTGIDQLNNGQYIEAMKKALPLGAANLIRAGQEWSQGYAADTGGRKLVDISGPEVFAQGLGFSSNALAKAYEMDSIDKQQLAFYQNAKRQFMTELTKAVVGGDTAKAQEIGQAIAAWNEHNPTMPLSFSPDSTRRMLQEAGQNLDRRTVMTLPKQLRGTSMEAIGLAGKQ